MTNEEFTKLVTEVETETRTIRESIAKAKAERTPLDVPALRKRLRELEFQLRTAHQRWSTSLPN